MLLLVTIGLVVVGAIALVIGFVSNSLAPIYLSIACSVIAGIVLVVFSRIARRGDSGTTVVPAQASPGSWAPSTTSVPPPPVPAPAMAPRYEPPPAPATPPRAPTARPAPARSTPVGRRPAARPEAEPEFEAEPTIVLDEAVPGGTGPDADGFPIAGYDSMRSSQIVAVVADLDLDELDMVQEREEQGKNRATVLRRVVERIDELEAEDVDEAPLEDELEDEEGEDLGPAAVAEDFPAAADDEFPATAADDGFPIADYDSLSVAEIIAVLDDLEDDELDLVAEREEMGENRDEILDYIDDMFEDVDGPPEPPAPRVVTQPAPRAVAKREPAAKAVAAKKAPVKKVAAARAPTKRAAAAPAGRKAAAVVKAVPRKTAAAKAPAAARGAAASPGTKSAGRRSAAPVAKAAKAAKTPAKAATRAVKKPAVKKAAATRKR